MHNFQEAMRIRRHVHLQDREDVIKPTGFMQTLKELKGVHDTPFTSWTERDMVYRDWAGQTQLNFIFDIRITARIANEFFGEFLPRHAPYICYFKLGEDLKWYPGKDKHDRNRSSMFYTMRLIDSWGV